MLKTQSEINHDDDDDDDDDDGVSNCMQSSLQGADGIMSDVRMPAQLPNTTQCLPVNLRFCQLYVSNSTVSTE